MVLVSDKPMSSTVLTGLIVMVMHFLHTGRQRHPLPGTEEPMITLDFITALFYEIDEQMGAVYLHIADKYPRLVDGNLSCEKYTCCTTILKCSKAWYPLEIRR
jgi:hypothetical protein